MAGTGRHAASDQLARADEADEAQRHGGGGAQAIAVDTLEGRAGGDRAAPLPGGPAERLAKAVEPGPAIGVIERDASRHLGDVGGGVESVAFKEGNVQGRGDALADRGLAATAHTHHDHGGGRHGRHAATGRVP